MSRRSRHTHVYAKRATLPKHYAGVVEARLEEFASKSTFDPEELQAVWADVLPEGVPKREPSGRVVISVRLQEALEMILRDCRKRPDNTCSEDDWVLLTRTVLPEVYADPSRQCRPTDSLPGSPEKLQTLELRAHLQLCLWHGADECDHGVEHSVCPAHRRKPAHKSAVGCASPEKPTRQEVRDEGRRQLRFWHPGMLRLEDALAQESAGYESGRHSHSYPTGAKCHAG